MLTGDLSDSNCNVGFFRQTLKIGDSPDDDDDDGDESGDT